MSGKNEKLSKAITEFKLPINLGFGQVMAPVMFKATYKNGKWDAGTLVPYEPIKIDPAAKVLHYAQTVFEGLKSLWVDSDEPLLFRPYRNLMRLNHSAERLCIPKIHEKLFFKSLNELITICRPIFPRNSGQSLYLRPFIIGTEANLNVMSSSSFEYYVLASPSEAYYSKPIAVKIEREMVRATSGGLGAYKAGANYASALKASTECITDGFDQILWINDEDKTSIEELSGMNIFAVIDNKLYAPRLSGSILPGITRNSLIYLAKEFNLEVVRTKLHYQFLIDMIKEKRCTEVFACGTAALISEIKCIGLSSNEKYDLPRACPKDSVQGKLKKALIDIQEGRATPPTGWIL